MRKKAKDLRGDAIAESRKTLKMMHADLKYVYLENERLIPLRKALIVEKGFYEQIYRLSGMYIQLLSSVAVKDPQTRQEIEDSLTMNELLSNYRYLHGIYSPTFNERLRKRSALLGRMLNVQEVNAVLREI